MSARKRHLFFYIGLVVAILAGNAIKNCVASPASPACRVAVERFPSVTHSWATKETDSDLERLLSELREGPH